MNIMQLIKFKALGRIVAFAGSIVGSSAFALDVNAVKTAVGNGVAILQTKQSVTDGGWGSLDDLAYPNTVAAVEALRAANQRTGTYYAGVAWLENHNATNVDLGAKKIMALVRHGNNVSPDMDLIQSSKQDTAQKGWGLSRGYFTSPLETALVLQALTDTKITTNQSAAVAYLVASQMSDNGWSIVGATKSDYWVTAEAVLALAANPSQPGVAAALTRAASFLNTVPAASVSSVVLAKVTLALFKLNGVNAQVDSLIATLLGKQIAAGNWGDTLSTANAVTALAFSVGLNTLSEATVVVVDQEQLRTAINKQLGHAAYGKLTQGDIRNLTSLDLRSASITNLNGLQGATSLTSLKVNSGTNLSAIAGLGITVVVDSDTDNIADASDNCPSVSNANQSNIDGDSVGDLCDADMDGDKMPNTWEVQFGLNPSSAADGTADADGDGLTNEAEYLASTNPRVKDTDGDGLDDGIEIANGLNPLYTPDAVMDFDQDGLTNAREIALRTNVNNPDTDADNTKDGDEVLAGRNPLLNEPVLIVIITSLLN